MAQHACKLGWFSDSEAQELIALADQVCLLLRYEEDYRLFEGATNVFLIFQMKNGFGNPENTIPVIQSPGGTLSQIMER